MNTVRFPFTMTALAALSLLAVGCSDARSTPPPSNDVAVPVRVITVEKAPLSRPIRAVGRLAHKRTLSLAFKNGGTITKLLAAEGETVHQGQRLAIVDATEISAQVAQARAQVDKADRDLQRVEKLAVTQAATRNDADNARTAVDVAHAALTQALYNHDMTVLVAPEAGRIDKKLVEVGEQVAPGRPIYAMSGSAAGYVVRIGVVDRDLPDIALGQLADVRVDALGSRVLRGVVSEIATAPSPNSGTYEIELRISDDQHAGRSDGLAAGMTTKVELHRAGPPLPLLPIGALVDADGMHAFVYRLVEPAVEPRGQASGLTVERVAVELDSIADDRVAVRRGLVGGERVVSEGASFVEPGRRVQPVIATISANISESR